MQTEDLAKLPTEVWVPLFWSQYNKLSEPLKEGFINMAYCMAVETGNWNASAEINSLLWAGEPDKRGGMR
jgi:hypothetical protein